ncbi:hypothetical protein [Vibrio parahaemolyticus]|uniref:hypothetical protein n=1 Tax=Vibrio parahaemolyticus TaxID=670 RepID=UPI000411F107|nr:hypothetical protein [Vibrio parahaemolyticus]HAS7010774.1 hypothetical protein [Vibrio parahaemolyticus]HCE2651563.1 hypothetical protein [Vibrio parahaemolyticus]HCE5036194.1 hypothetical protein [Vibrio parahaemolyticus]HCG8974452.1 hypothetical protein [Vibrio parahaemolyticus]HCG9764983.1 hypothetical protein [Vibrio parahaemolyticus]
MSNWFENNPTKSVIVHTFVVAAATWAAFTFVFDENRVKLHEAKVARAESETKEVNARNTVLITRIDYLTKENERLVGWLEEQPNTIPHYEKLVAELTEKVSNLEKELIVAKDSDSNEQVDLSWAKDLIEKYNKTKVSSVQQSIFDPLTGVVVGADRVSIDGTTDIKITFPDGQKINQKAAAPGETWDFVRDGKNYRLILDSVDWSTQQYGTRVVELNSQLEK